MTECCQIFDKGCYHHFLQTPAVLLGRQLWSHWGDISPSPCMTYKHRKIFCGQVLHKKVTKKSKGSHLPRWKKVVKTNPSLSLHFLNHHLLVILLGPEAVPPNLPDQRKFKIEHIIPFQKIELVVKKIILLGPEAIPPNLPKGSNAYNIATKFQK